MQLSPRELSLYAEGRNKAHLEAYREAVSVAYLQAWLSRMDVGKRGEKWPKLDSLLPRNSNAVDSWREKNARAAARLLAFAKSGEVKFAKKGEKF